MNLREIGDYSTHRLHSRKSAVDDWCYSNSFQSDDNHAREYPQNWCDEVDRTASSRLTLDVKPSLKQPVSDGNSSDKKRIVKSLFDDEEEEEDEDDEDIDFEGWKSKRIEEWIEKDTRNWLFSASQQLGQLYHQISPELVLPGKKLLLLSREDFRVHDDRFGEELYDSLYDILDSENSFHCPDHQEDSQEVIEFKLDLQLSDDGSTHGQDSDSTEEDSLSEMVKRRPGRPRNVKSKVREAGPKIWEFIRNLLQNPKYCPDLIRWVNYEEKTFRFVDTQKVAEHWGARNDNQKMNFEKFSRAMRYYYDKDILKSVPRRRLVYQFGPSATGLDKIKFPDFEDNYFNKP